MMFDKLAEELKEARLKNELSIQQLSSKTRIDVKFLEAMEAGDFSYLPEIYVKAFTKQYAKAVDLDEDIIGKKYEAAKKGIPFDTQEVPDIKSSETKSEQEISKERKLQETTVPPHTYDAVKSSAGIPADFTGRDKKRIIFGSIIIGVIIVFAFIYFLFFNRSPEIIVPEKPIEEVIQENKDRFVENEITDTLHEVPLKAQSDSLLLTIFANDTSWVKIILDDKKVDEFILFPKSQKSIAAENNYKITFGNAGGIELRMNNKSLEFTGKKSGVKYVLIDKSGIQNLNNPPSL